MPQTLTKSVIAYKYDELSEDAKENARQKLYDINVDYVDWHEFVYEDAKTIASLMGIEIDKIYFSGFWSQGDGACFEGTYSYKKASVKAVMAHAPKDSELHRIAKDLAAIQKPHFYSIGARIKHSGHYSHAYCTDIDVYHIEDNYRDIACIDDIKEALRDYMNWIYKQLEKEYEYQTSIEAIEETIRINEYDFKEDGSFPAL